ncbi:hypothetical protein AUJ84_01425 [Candidatus Pacearchaeota archaeon CG1_02_32_132]|nr:MAG: hypothetical protein AUJ84_01425 [Candidatus Pacearchaeota archaeon CG1_02_32_132]
MDTKGILINELIKRGYSESNKNRIWNMANRSLLHLTPEMSKVFLKLLDYPPYKKNVFEVELNLVNDNAKLFLKTIGDKPFNLIDIGCGNGMKAKEFIKNMHGKPNIKYCPISGCSFLTDVAIENIKKGNFTNIAEFKPHIADYKEVDEFAGIIRTDDFQKNVFLLHGSILASYEINDFLFKLSKSMFSGDYIIIGNGIRKGERLVDIDKYKNQVFKDWLIHLMKYLGFSEDEVEYDARFNEKRVEFFFKIKKDKKISHEDKEMQFKKGDEIIVFILYKYYMEELENFFKMYFCDVKMVKDEHDEYTLALCKT